MKTLLAIIVTTIPILFNGGFYHVHAQNTATVQVTAEMLDPVTVISSSGMDFGGDLLPGIPQSISRTDASAAKFHINAVSGNRINVNFTLPDMLIHELGDDEMPISFAPNDAGQANSDDISSASAFDPNVEASLQVFGGQDFFIWLGGTINPRGDQMAGAYTGDVTIDLTYTNN